MDGIRVIDTHTHYASNRFDCDRDKILSALPEHGIPVVIEAAIGFDSNDKMLELCKKYLFVYTAVGVHPNCVKELDEEKFEKITQMLEHKKVLAVGETGLDYSKRNDENDEEFEKFIALQKKWLKCFIELALAKKMPLVIHCREMKAYDDLVDILLKYDFGNQPGIIHCFSGNAEHAKRLTEQGFLLGIGGKFLRKTKNEEDIKAVEELKEVIKGVPMESIVLETDAPFLKPDDPYLEQDALPEKRNTSLNLKSIVKELAKLKGVEEEKIYETAWKNTLRLYPALENNEIFDTFW